MSDVFISYGRNDWHRAQQLARILEDWGLSVWWDRKIPLGKTFDRVIQKALDRAPCILVMWSTTSVESSWVRDEAWIGLSRRVLVPVLVDDVAIPLGFGRIQTANLVEWTGDASHPELLRLKESIERLLRRDDTIDSPAAASAPEPARAHPVPARPLASRRRSVRAPSVALLRQRRLSAARREPRGHRWRPWVLLSVLMGLLAFGFADGRWRLQSLPGDIAEFSRLTLGFSRTTAFGVRDVDDPDRGK